MKYLLAAAAVIALASPAAARDGSGYAGIEGGVLIPRDDDPASDVDRRFPGGEWVDFLDVDHNLGFDIGLIAGYDFGMFRLEGELAYKRASHKEYEIDGDAPGPFPVGGSEPVFPGAEIDADGRTSATSVMVNALFDVGDDDGLSFYAGGGLGIAWVRMKIDELGSETIDVEDTDFPAWQIIAGVRMAISDSVDVGLKYRYFAAGTLKDDDDSGFDRRSSFQTHSLLASLILNFGSRPAPPPPPPPLAPPPPPPPPPPATQTCPDGSVILATDACPLPPPPPPPPPEPERG